MVLWRLRMERIRRRSATTGLMVDASLKVHATVGVLSLYEDGTRQDGSVQIRGDVASCMTRAVSSRSEFVIHPFELSRLTRSATTSREHSTRQTKCSLLELGSSHTPPAPSPETSTNRRIRGETLYYLCQVSWPSLHGLT